jgi:hypothetical protein
MGGDGIDADLLRIRQADMRNGVRREVTEGACMQESAAFGFTSVTPRLAKLQTADLETTWDGTPV